MNENVVKELDTSGMSCPMPILRLKQTLGGLESGQRVRVIATDPGSQSDFAAFSAQTGNRLVDSQTEDGKFIYIMEKA